MCGISGLFGPDGDDMAVARSMASLLQHRGPDGTRAWSTPCRHGGVGFGHTRLSIVDLAGSDQPLYSDNGCVLIVNGEIYNHLKLRKEVESKKVDSEFSKEFWSGGSDTETLLACFSVFGIKKLSSEFFNKQIGKLTFILCIFNPIFFGHMGMKATSLFFACMELVHVPMPFCLSERWQTSSSIG